jgi:hypothetical protein
MRHAGLAAAAPVILSEKPGAVITPAAGSTRRHSEAPRPAHGLHNMCTEAFLRSALTLRASFETVAEIVGK